MLGTLGILTNQILKEKQKNPIHNTMLSLLVKKKIKTRKKKPPFYPLSISFFCFFFFFDKTNTHKNLLFFLPFLSAFLLFFLSALLLHFSFLISEPCSLSFKNCRTSCCQVRTAYPLPSFDQLGANPSFLIAHGFYSHVMEVLRVPDSYGEKRRGWGRGESTVWANVDATRWKQREHHLAWGKNSAEMSRTGTRVGEAWWNWTGSDLVWLKASWSRQLHAS